MQEKLQEISAAETIPKSFLLFSFFRFLFTRKKSGLLEKLAGELDAGQIAEIRLGIEDGLNEEQLILLATGSMDAEKIRELRMAMKILNERGGRERDRGVAEIFIHIRGFSALERNAPVQRAGEGGWKMSSEITDALLYFSCMRRLD